MAPATMILSRPFWISAAFKFSAGGMWAAVISGARFIVRMLPLPFSSSTMAMRQGRKATKAGLKSTISFAVMASQNW